MIKILLFQIMLIAIGLSISASGGLAHAAPQQAPGTDPWVTQHEPQQIVVRGEISGGSPLKSATIELRPFSGGAPQTTMPRDDGTFQFTGVVPGQYEIRVSDTNGGILYIEVVSLRLDVERLNIRVPDNPVPHTDSEIVSVKQLQHKIPGKAMKEFSKGTADLKKRQFPSAIDHLKTAVALDPAFAEAHNSLGFAYVRLNQYQQSLEQFQKAVELAPNYQLANDNLCMTLLKMKRFAEAEQVADGVLKHGSNSAIAHYSLAVGLLVEGGSRNQALDHLQRAEDRMPPARLLAAAIFDDTGRRADAARELEAYLSSTGGDSRRAEVEAWLARLKE